MEYELKDCPFCKSPVTLRPFTSSLSVIACKPGSLCDQSGLMCIIDNSKLEVSIKVWNTR